MEEKVLGYDCDGLELYEFDIVRAPWYSEMDFEVLPSSTVTSNGTSMIKLIFSLLCAAATFGLNASNCAGW